MITIGVVSDIHADLDALERALEVLAAAGVDAIVCAGDLVDKGPDDAGVVARLRELEIPCVRGNHDETRARYAALSERAGAKPLERSQLEWLEALPTTLTRTWAGVNVLVAHGTPGSNWEYWPDRAPKGFDRWAASTWYDVVILGHTHRPMALERCGVYVVNPGSVTGRRPRDSGTCGVLHLPEKRFEILEVTPGEGRELSKARSAGVE